MTKRSKDADVEFIPDTRTILARWRCPDCGVTVCGFISPKDRAQRYCHGIPKRPHAAAEICAGSMQRMNTDPMTTGENRK